MAALLSFGLAAILGPGTATAADERVAGEVVVGFKPAAQRGAVRREVGARLLKTLGEPRQQLLRLPSGASVDAAVRRLERRAGVAYAEPNFVVHAATLPNDPLFGRQWALRNTGQLVEGVAGTAGEDVRAQAAWDLTQGSDDVLVAVADTGIAYNNSDVTANVWRNPGESGSGREHNGVDDDGNGIVDDVFPQDLIDSDYNPFDENGHGTEVAGVLAARGNNGAGMTGLAWRAKILPIRVLDRYGTGDTATVAQGFRDAAKHGARIVNASLEGLLSDAVGDAIEDAQGTLFVVAAGNSGISVDDYEASYPCAYTFENLLCVGATGATGALASFSNYGSTSVDLVAPGVSVLAPQPQRRTVWTEDFETPLAGRWTSGGTGDQWGRSTLWAGSPTHSLADSPDGDHGPNVDSWVETVESLDLSGLGDCRLDYTVENRGANESYFSLVAVREDGETVDLAQLHEESDGRHSASFAGASGEAGVRVRVTFFSNDFVDDGVYLDDLEVHCVDPALPGTGHGLVSGTSFASPLVAAAAVLRRSLHPGESIAQTRAAILGGARIQPSLGGKIAGNRSLDARGALGPGPSPTPTPAPAPAPAPGAVLVPPPLTPAAPRPPRAWTQIASRSVRGRALLGRVSVRVPARARLTVTCTGRGCPFARRAYARRSRARVLVLRALRGARLRPGARLRFVLRPRRGKARVARYVVTRTGALRRR